MNEQFSGCEGYLYVGQLLTAIKVISETYGIGNRIQT